MDQKAQWSIKRRLLLLALTPTLTISVLLSILLSYSYFKDLEQLVQEHGTITTLQLARLSNFAITSKQPQLTQSLLNTALEEPSVRAVTLYDHNHKRLAHSGPNMYKLTSEKRENNDNLSFTVTTKNTFRITAPIIQNNLANQSDSYASQSSTPSLIGWLEVEISQTNIAIKQYQALFFTTLISVIAIFICGIIALKMSKKIINPLLVVSNGIERIKDGNLESRIPINEVSGLENLASGVNSMASTLQEAQDEMQKNINQATEDLRETLETIEIQNIELDLARKEAIEASRIKSEFLANTSHEIRTPLNGIVGFTNLLLKGHLIGRQREYLTTIHQSSENLLNIINDILDFSKIEAGKLMLDHIPMNLRDIIEESLHILAPSAHEKNLELIQFIYSDVPVNLVGDPLRLKQVLTNLVSNAIKFTDHGNIIIRVMLENIKDQHATFTINITDEGIGLDEKQRNILFNAFTQADASTSRRFGGTGLGLAICKRLVEQMSGDIGIESEPDKGSTFWFTIRSEIDSAIDNKQDLSQLNGQAILYCEPNPMTLTSISHLFEEWQVNIDTCTNINTIISKVEKQADTLPYKAVVIGLNPEQDSTESIRKIVRQLNNEYKCGTVILSSTLIKDRFDDAIESYSAICLGKPASHYKLYDALCSLVLRTVRPTTLQQLRAIPRISNDNLKPLKVLAVDDNAANLKLVTELLRSFNADIYQASCGEDALKHFNQHRFDIVFMDIQMPGMDGVETTKCMRALEAGEHRTPIVALTAHALIEEKRQLIAAGLDDHLAKPLDENSLTRILRKWCNRNETNTEHDFLPPLRSSSKTMIHEPNSTKPGAVVDKELSLKLSNGKVDLAKDMLTMLLDSLTTDQHTINDSFTQKDYDNLLEQIHRLHGATCYCGVPRLKDIASSTETLIKQENWTELDIIMDRLNDEIDALLDWKNNQDIDSFFA